MGGGNDFSSCQGLLELFFDMAEFLRDFYFLIVLQALSPVNKLVKALKSL
jgi:hypothetical protein